MVTGVVVCSLLLLGVSLFVRELGVLVRAFRLHCGRRDGVNG